LAVLTVGTGQQYAKLSAAIAASHDGDVIKVKAGTYQNDSAIIRTKITIEGVGGQVNLVSTGAIANRKAILVTNNDLTLNNISFSGAKVADGNGAGVRYQAGDLVLNNCYFHDNQDGLLAADNATGTITVNNTEFAHNGTGDGKTHNIYVGKIAQLTINNSYFHDAVVGHEIKSRAATTIIQNSRIFDGSSGSASYSVDLPNGGKAILSNNIIEQGPKSQNPAIIHFGGEGTPYAGSTLTISGNTIINDLVRGSSRALLNHTSTVPKFSGNTLWGLTPAQVATGPVNASGTAWLTARPVLATAAPWSPVVSGGQVATLAAPAATQFLQAAVSEDTSSAATATADLVPFPPAATLTDLFPTAISAAAPSQSNAPSPTGFSVAHLDPTPYAPVGAVLSNQAHAIAGG
jgi:hypothetical protein